MNKKKTELLSWGATILAAVCGLVAFAMIFAAAINTKTPPYSILQESYTGIQTALGCSTASGYTVFNASACVILAFALPLIALCVAVMGKGFKIASAVAAAIFIAGAALALTVTSTVRPAVNFPEISLAAGPIVSAVFSLLGALSSIGGIVLEVFIAKEKK
ncbi:MAG: hypothetical protein J6U39_03070 [Clostridia bacterium]|nr:hypothetical protein [Clostridia bacterium]